MTIHSEHPFHNPEPDQARRFRGRLGGQVSLWTTGVGADRAGLTVSSLMVANGEPPRILALLDPDSDFFSALTDTGCAVVQLLRWRHRDLSEAFAGVAPAPGGVFRFGEWEDTQWGPRLLDVSTWAGVSLADTRDVGWSTEVVGDVEAMWVGDEDDALLHRRGRYGSG